MYQELGSAELRSGETLTIGVVQAPDEAFRGRIEPFLAHKGSHWTWHIERCMREPLDRLETRFHVGMLGDEIIAQIMTVESEGVGILGHVFTQPEHRRKGACKAVMAQQMEHFRQRGGRALYLGTGYASHAYHIYASFGFQSVLPRSGFMRYWNEPDFEGKYFAPGKTRVKSVEWQDWPKLTALTGLVGHDQLRSMAWGMVGATNFEGGFLGFKHDLETSQRYAAARLLENETGAIVGVLTLLLDYAWRGTHLLDLFVHPSFWKDAPLLLETLDCSGKVQCYVDNASMGKLEALRQAGFVQEAVLERQMAVPGGRMDVYVLSKWY